MTYSRTGLTTRIVTKQRTDAGTARESKPHTLATVHCLNGASVRGSIRAMGDVVAVGAGGER